MATTIQQTTPSATQLTLEQQAAINAPLPTVTLACPGTGKTKTMIERIIKAHKSDGICLDNMFVATFSKYAANDMTERLIEAFEDTPEFIGTFHRNCIRLWKAYPQLITNHGYTVRRISFASNADCENIIENKLAEAKEEIKGLGLTVRDIKVAFKTVIDYLKALGIYPIDYHGYVAPTILGQAIKELILKRLKGVGETILSQYSEESACNALWTIYTFYQQSLKDTNMLDYNDVIALPVFAMRDKSIAQTVASHFKLVLIDEFQDCSTMQFELTQQLSNNYDTAFLVGDEDQLLYEWRDASLEKVMSFYEDKSFNVRLLQGNFRSQKPIIDLAIQIITRNKKRYNEKVMHPMRTVENENPVYFIQPYDERFEAVYIADQIKSILGGEHSEIGEVHANDIAIIFPNRYYRDEIETALRKEKIDYNFVKGYGFYEYKEVINVLSYLSVALDSDDDNAFRRIMNYPLRGNALSFQGKLQAAAKKSGLSLFKTMQTDATCLHYRDNEQFVKTIIDTEALMRAKKTPHEVIAHLEKELDLETKMLKELGELECKDRLSRIDQLAKLLTNLLSEYNGSYKDAIDELWNDIFSTPKEVTEDKVQLMTAFGSKGLEFKVVYIIGAVNGNFPSYNEGSTAESGRRIFYVACTRAKDLLVISAPKYLHRTGTLVECMPTLFLDGLGDYYEAIALEEKSFFQNYQATHTLDEPSGKQLVDKLPEGFND